MKNLNTKRRIGLYMAVVMLFNLFMPFAMPVMVHAAPAFTVDETSSLTPGTASWTPVFVGPGGDQAVYDLGRRHDPSQMILSFPIATDDTDTYQLRFELANNWEIIVSVVRGAHGMLRVTYAALRTGGLPHPAPNFSIAVPATTYAPTYLPFSSYMTQPAGGARPPSFRGDFEDPTEFGWGVIYDIVGGVPVAHDPPFNTVAFYVPDGEGFSFSLFQREVHILYDDGRFHFATVFPFGDLHEVTLSRDYGAGMQEYDRAFINTGFNVGTRPFANVVEPGQAIPAGRITEMRNARWRPHIIYHSTHPDGILPGGPTYEPSNPPQNQYPRFPAMPTEPGGITLVIDVPTPVTDPGGMDLAAWRNQFDGVNATVSMTAEGGGLGSIQFTLFDIFGVAGDVGIPGHTMPAVTIDGAEVHAFELFRCVNGLVYRIELDLLIFDPSNGEFLPGILYNDEQSHIMLNRSPAAVAQGAPRIIQRGAPIQNAYTLLHFEVIRIDGVYHIYIPQPSYNIIGEFVVLESSMPSFPAPLPGSVVSILQRTGPVQPGERIMPIPVIGNPFSPGRYFQIFFQPGTGFEPAEIDILLTGIPTLNNISAAHPYGMMHPALTNVLRSQVLFFRGDPTAVDLSAPRHFSVELIEHIPMPGDMTRRTGEAEIVTRWDIGTHAPLNGHFYRIFEAFEQNGTLVIEYDISWASSPYVYGPDHHPGEPTRNPEELFARVRVSITSPGALGPGSSIVYELIDPATGLPVDRLEGIYIVDAGIPQPFTSPEPNIAPGNPHPMFGYMAEVRFRVHTYHELLNPGVAPPEGLPFPWIHFMNVQGHGITLLPDGTIGIFGEGGRPAPPVASQPDSFTLSEFDEHDLPPPQNLIVHPGIVRSYAEHGYDRVAFAVSWTVPQLLLRNYLRDSFGLLDVPGSQFEFWMNLYVSHYEDLMSHPETGFWRTNNVPHTQDATTSELRLGARQTIAATTAPIGQSVLPDVNVYGSAMGNNALHFSASNTGRPGATVANMTIPGFAEPRDALRAGEIVQVARLELADEHFEAMFTSPSALVVTYVLEGLDRNQQYFVYVDFVMRQVGSVYDRDGSPVHIDITEASILSNLDGMVMPGDPEIPDGIDREPPAIDLNVKDITMSSAILYWNRIEEANPPREAYTVDIQYEIIRTRDNQMAAIQLNNRVPFGDIWRAIYPSHEDIIGLRTSGAALEAWTGTAWGDEPEPTIRIISDEYGDPIELLDASLRSNTLYFYYVRVVRTVVGPSVPGGLTTFSVWAHATVTTDIAGAPINLRVESGPDHMGEGFDRMHEVMISFEAPIIFDGLANVISGANRQVLLEYQLRRDEDDWLTPVEMRPSFLMQHAEQVLGDANWTWFLYHITGLEAGETYSIRVRLVELLEGERVSESMWSNTVIWNTDGDPDEDEYDRREQDWEDYLRRRLLELLRRPYWVIRDDPSAFHVIYRINMFNNVLAEAVGGRIHLPVENARQTVYYFPIAAFSRAWETEAAFVLNNPYGNMQIMVPARSIDLHDNDQVIDVGATIRRNEFSDYMVRFAVNWSNPPYVQGQETFTHVADIRFDLVSTRTRTINAWELDLAESLIDRVEELITESMVDIRRAIRNHETAEDISREMVRIVEIAARQSLARIVNDNFRELNVRNRIVEVPRLDRAMTVAVQLSPAMAGPGLSIQAYQSPGTNLWNNVPTMDVLDSQGLFTLQLGPVVFVGRVVVIQGIEQVTGGPVATGVVARHGLDDFFGRDRMNVHQLATRSQLVNSVARMMGAPRGVDAVPWLRNNGVNVAAAGMNNPITNQSALHLIMLVYEAQTGTAASSLRITNFAVVNNLPGLDAHYRTSVAAAIELGLVNGHNLQPGGQLSVGDLLEILAQLDRLIGLR